MNSRDPDPLFLELAHLAMECAHTDGVHSTRVPQLKIIRSDCTTLPAPGVYRPSLCLVVQGEKEVVVGHRVYRFSPAQFLVISIDLPVTAHVIRASRKVPFLCLSLELEPGTVFSIIRDLDPLRPERSAPGPGILLGPTDSRITEACLRLLRCLRNPEEITVLAPSILREITYRLLDSPFGPMVLQLGVAGSQVERIGRAVDVIRERFDQPLKTEELARLVNMSVSSFHQHFRRVTTLSPLQYQKELRLQEARRLLGTEVTDAATAALRVGYESPSQFSREYARMFGLPPISDLKRMRGGSGGA